MSDFKKYLTEGKKAEFNLLLILILIFSVGIGCANFTKKDTDDEPTIEKTDTKRDSDDSKSDNRNDSDNDKTDLEPVEKADASTGEVPDEAQLQAMAKETMLDFNDAIQDEDFSGFYDNISKVWQKETSPEDLEKGFKVFMDKNADFSQIRKLEADITGTPKIKRELGYKMLNLSGVYDTSPLPTKFDLKYVPQGKDWKLSYIRVSTKPN